MFDLIKNFLSARFSNPEVAVLWASIIGWSLVVLFFGKILAPVFAGLILAFLFEPIVVAQMKFLKFPRLLAVTFVFLGFVGLMVFSVIWLLPILWKQITQLNNEIPVMFDQAKSYLLNFSAQYPNVLSQNSVHNLLSSSVGSAKYTSVGQVVLTYSINSIREILSWLVYLLLVPLLVLFFLKDKNTILNWLVEHLPNKKGLLVTVGEEMKVQLGNYVRGKFIEAIIVAISTYILFELFGLNYATLLATLVGVSVIIPYVGMVLVTIPVVMVGLVQWGFDAHFLYMFISYLILQALDGNVLVPVLFSEAVNLHPIAIITAVLFFGGIWGFWGLFFAIPLATLVKTLINAWMKAS